MSFDVNRSGLEYLPDAEGQVGPNLVADAAPTPPQARSSYLSDEAWFAAVEQYLTASAAHTAKLQVELNRATSLTQAKRYRSIEQLVAEALKELRVAKIDLGTVVPATGEAGTAFVDLSQPGDKAKPIIYAGDGPEDELTLLEAAMLPLQNLINGLADQQVTQDELDAVEGAALKLVDFNDVLALRLANIELDGARIAGVVPAASIPNSVRSAPIIPLDGNGDPGQLTHLSEEQINRIGEGSAVVVSTGETFYYKGTGLKTLAASYVTGADTTPAWSQISGKPIFSAFATSSDAANLTGQVPAGVLPDRAIANITGLQVALDAKRNASDSYSSAQVDGFLALKQDASSAFSGDAGDLTGSLSIARVPDGLLTIAKTSGLQTALNAKADSATSLAGYGITDAYTRSAIDGLLGQRALQSEFAATKAKVDNFLNDLTDPNLDQLSELLTELAEKANALDVYTQAQVDTALAGKLGTAGGTLSGNLRIASNWSQFIIEELDADADQGRWHWVANGNKLHLGAYRDDGSWVHNILSFSRNVDGTVNEILFDNGQVVFDNLATLKSELLMQSVLPRINLHDTDSPADRQRFAIAAQGGAFVLDLFTDAGVYQQRAYQLLRNADGTALRHQFTNGDIELANGKLTIAGNDVVADYPSVIEDGNSSAQIQAGLSDTRSLFLSGSVTLTSTLTIANGHIASSVAGSSSIVVGASVDIEDVCLRNANIPADGVPIDKNIRLSGLTIDGSTRETPDWLANPANNNPITNPISDYRAGGALMSGVTAATATTGTIGDGFIKTYTVTNGGSGYVDAPIVRVVGDGVGARATATVSGGVVTAITADDWGRGYTTATVELLGGNGDVNDLITANRREPDYLLGAELMQMAVAQDYEHRNIKFVGGEGFAAFADRGSKSGKLIDCEWRDGGQDDYVGSCIWAQSFLTPADEGVNPAFSWTEDLTVVRPKVRNWKRSFATVAAKGLTSFIDPDIDGFGESAFFVTEHCEHIRIWGGRIAGGRITDILCAGVETTGEMLTLGGGLVFDDLDGQCVYIGRGSALIDGVEIRECGNIAGIKEYPFGPFSERYGFGVGSAPIGGVARSDLEAAIRIQDQDSDPSNAPKGIVIKNVKLTAQSQYPLAVGFYRGAANAIRDVHIEDINITEVASRTKLLDFVQLNSCVDFSSQVIVQNNPGCNWDLRGRELTYHAGNDFATEFVAPEKGVIEANFVLHIKNYSGSPEGVLIAKQGSTVERTDGAYGTIIYTKTSEGGSDGWIGRYVSEVVTASATGLGDTLALDMDGLREVRLNTTAASMSNITNIVDGVTYRFTNLTNDPKTIAAAVMQPPADLIVPAASSVVLQGRSNRFVQGIDRLVQALDVTDANAGVTSALDLSGIDVVVWKTAPSGTIDDLEGLLAKTGIEIANETGGNIALAASLFRDPGGQTDLVLADNEAVRLIPAFSGSGPQFFKAA